MTAPAKKSRILDFLLIFAVVYLLSQFALQWFMPQQDSLDGTVTVEPQDATLRTGQHPVIIIANNTQSPLSIPDRCPRPPLDIFRVGEGNALTDVTSDEPAAPCEPVEDIPSGQRSTVDLAPWLYTSFAQTGVYEVELPLSATGSAAQALTGASVGTGDEESQYRDGIITRFTIEEPGVFVKLFRALITKPFLNFLILVGDVLPNHSLAIGIIILTLLVKLLLFLPTQHAMEGQKKMQLLQPKLEAVKKKHAGDPQKIQAETMRLWKEHGINPFQSCLPLLLQFPVLIGLLYVIQDGTVLGLSQHLIYDSFTDIDWSFNTNFFGLDLTEPNYWLFPPLLVVLQYLQMKLSFHIAGKKKKDDTKKEKKDEVPAVDAQQLQQKIMLYALPLMIGFFALRFPAAVALYWGVSTLFAIGQQMIVNREHLKV